MKITFCVLALLTLQSLHAQQNVRDSIFLSDCSGNYGTGDSALFQIVERDNQLYFSTDHYGKIKMLPIPNNRFQLEHVNPVAILYFEKDTTKGRIRLLIDQKGSFTWLKDDSLIGYTGKYHQDIDPFNFIYITGNAGLLKNKDQTLVPGGKDRFTGGHNEYHFIRDKHDRVEKLVIISLGTQRFNKLRDNSGQSAQSAIRQHISNRQNGFVRADTLRGMLTPARTCYDVLFYDLDVSVDPETRSIQGKTIIRFRTIHDFDSLQIDLYANMKIEKILYQDRSLSWSTESNAVFVHFPESPDPGSVHELQIVYSGQPRRPDPDALAGGWFWLANKEGKMWIESVCQGAGASLWWPCKDHLSDKPDSMKISITVPAGLTDISNGSLRKVTTLPGNRTRFDWYVSYPINTYNVVVNIGDYAHFTDVYVRGKDSLQLNFYSMPYDLALAKKIFGNARSMLALFEKRFGPYPFPKDGFTLMESIYAMEHQGAVSIGLLNRPLNSDRYDSADLTRLMWHESSHEWWGNSVTCTDFADFWIHESFATYAELIAFEELIGKDAMERYLRQQAKEVENKEPIIGLYDVNNFHMGDMYPKGALMLNTLRHVIDNDSLWFSILKGIQTRFRYQSIKTPDIVNYISRMTGKDYTAFFDQYLRYTTIPVLDIETREEGSSLQLRYKWHVDVPVFDMPVKVTTEKDKFSFIYPGIAWQTATLSNMRAKDFKVDTKDFYITVANGTLQPAAYRNGALPACQIYAKWP